MKAIVLGLVLSACVTGAYGQECRRGLSEPISVTEWAIEPVDDNTNRLYTTFSNDLDRPVRMIDASAGFLDALGGVIATFALDRDVEVAPGDTFEQVGLWGPSTFERLLDLRPEEVTAYVCTRSVLYDDGTVERFE